MFKKKILVFYIFFLFIVLVSTSTISHASVFSPVDWVTYFFKHDTGNNLLKSKVSTLQNQSDNGIEVTINSVVTDGFIIYLHFSVNGLTKEDVTENLDFKIDVVEEGSQSHFDIVITPIDIETENGLGTDYVLTYAILGLENNLLGQTINIISNYENSKWVFEIKLNNTIASASYTMQDGTNVLCTPISLTVEKTNYFYSSTADEFFLELKDGTFVKLPRGVSFVSGVIDENGNTQADIEISLSAFEKLINPSDVYAIWVDDSVIELYTNIEEG